MTTVHLSSAVLFFAIARESFAFLSSSFSFTLTSALDPLYGVELESTVPAVDQALDYINNNSSLLPGLRLSYRNISILECDAQGDAAIRADLGDVGVLGYSCEEETTPSFLISETTQMIFTPSFAMGRFTNGFYKLHPVAEVYAQVVVTFVRQFDWQRFSILTSEGNFFEDVLETSVKLVENSSNIVLIQPDSDGTMQLPKDVRIFFLNMDTWDTMQIMCKAYRLGLSFPHYVWIAYARDYVIEFEQEIGGEEEEEESCSGAEIAELLDGILLIQARVEPQNNALNGIQELLQSSYDQGIDAVFTPLVYFAFDAVWLLANALNSTLNNTLSRNLNYSNQQVTCGDRCQDYFQNINTEGLTGNISFDSFGSRTQHVLGFSQYRRNVSGDVLEDILVATIRITSEEEEFGFVNGENSATIFRGPVPSDGTPVKGVHIIPLPLTVVYYIIAALGVAFALVCLLFIIIFRKRKIVKLISPNLNYFIIAGALCLYGSIFFRLTPITAASFNSFLCSFQVIVTILGYSLCFSPVLVKMWRVYYIFHNPSPNKKAVTDLQLIVAVCVIISIIIVIILIGLVVPPLRPTAQLFPDEERPTGLTEDGITIEFCSYECYGGAVYPLAWTAVEFLYLILLQVAALILAILTRKVTVRVLNDFKEMVIIIYSTSFVVLVLGVVTFSINAYIIVTEVLFSGGILIATSIFLFFIFVPKMYFLYRDPKGKNIFSSTAAQSENKTNVVHYSRKESQLPISTKTIAM